MKKTKQILVQFKNEVKNEVIYSDLFVAFFLFSIAMLLVSSIFQVPGLAGHPQFNEYTDTGLLWELMHENDGAWLWYSFYSYFILDCIWPVLLFLVVYKIMRSRHLKDPAHFTRKLLRTTVFLMILAYIADVAENGNYWKNFSYNAYLAYTKIGLYASVFLLLLYSFLNVLINDFLPTLWVFIRSAFISLLILIIIGFLLPTASQVNSIVVDLYLEPHNLMILLLFLPFFGIAVAHYPSYFDYIKGRKTWYMADYSFFRLIGIIYYRNKKYDKNGKVNTATLNFLYRVLGISFYTAVFYMISYTSEVNFGWKLQMGKLSFAFFISGVFLLYFLMNIKSEWYKHHYAFLRKHMTQFYDGDYTPPEEKQGLINFPLPKWLWRYLQPKAKKEGDETAKRTDLKTINIPVAIYLILFTLTVFFHIGFFVALCSSKLHYSEGMALLSLIAIVLQMVTFIFYRAFRSLLRIVLYNPCSRAITNAFLENPDINNYDCKAPEGTPVNTAPKKVVDFFNIYNFSKGTLLLRLFTFLRWGAFSNNILFLQVNAFIGIVNLVFLMVINCESSRATYFSTIVIILSVLFLVYGVFVVVVKNWIYHDSKTNRSATKGQPSTTTFDKLLFAGLAILLVFAIVTKTKGNELFTLEPVKRAPNSELVLSQYIDSLDKEATRYYIGCYGGGMKSNAWTMTVLDTLFGQNTDLLEKTVGISGVSGGTMGMVNFFSIWNKHGHTGYIERAESIKDVATQNILAMDITHATGRDLLRYLFWPGNSIGKDRSTKVMEHYASTTGDNYEEKKSRNTFRGYWRHFYDTTAAKTSFPIFIANTTNVAGNQGMAVSIRTVDHNLNSVLYRGADDILELQRTEEGKPNAEYTLGYYEAASTSNRFPLLSPAAKIETKGHYNDGGIFENSGLFSAYKLFQAVNEKEQVKNLEHLPQNNVFVCVINDKNLYIKAVLQQELNLLNDAVLVDEINYNSELGAILNSVASTEMTPIAIKSQLQRLAKNYSCMDYEAIYLPHTFTLADVKAIYGKKLRLRSQRSADSLVYAIAKRNNATIAGLYGKYPVIEPPMSRVMAAPAYDFMKAMLQHPMTQTSIRKIKALNR